MVMFVYGTLKKGYGNHKFLKGAKYLGLGEIDGFAIYELGRFPGIKYKPGSSVEGELYEIDEIILKGVDHLEGEGFLYNRVKTMAKDFATGNPIEASVYVYNHEVDEKFELHRKWERRE